MVKILEIDVKTKNPARFDESPDEIGREKNLRLRKLVFNYEDNPKEFYDMLIKKVDETFIDLNIIKNQNKINKFYMTDGYESLYRMFESIEGKLKSLADYLYDITLASQLHGPINNSDDILRINILNDLLMDHIHFFREGREYFVSGWRGGKAWQGGISRIKFYERYLEIAHEQRYYKKEFDNYIKNKKESLKEARLVKSSLKSNHKTCLNENHSTDKKTTLLGRRVFFQYEDNPIKFFDNLLEKIKDVMSVMNQVAEAVTLTSPGDEEQVSVWFDNMMEKMLELKRYLDIVETGFVEHGYMHDKSNDFEEIMKFKNRYFKNIKDMKSIRSSAAIVKSEIFHSDANIRARCLSIKIGLTHLTNYVSAKKIFF